MTTLGRDQLLSSHEYETGRVSLDPHDLEKPHGQNHDFRRRCRSARSCQEAIMRHRIRRRLMLCVIRLQLTRKARLLRHRNNKGSPLHLLVASLLSVSRRRHAGPFLRNHFATRRLLTRSNASQTFVVCLLLFQFPLVVSLRLYA